MPHTDTETAHPTGNQAAAESGAAANAHPAAIIADAAVASATHLVDITNKMMAGTYTSATAVNDAAACAKRASAVVAKSVSWLTSLISGTPSPAPTLKASGPTAPVVGALKTPIWQDRRTVTTQQRPLTLTTAGFRCMGGGPAIAIPASKVTVDPAVLTDLQTTSFVITVNMAGAAPGVYDGTVTAIETKGQTITDSVMPTT